MSLSRPLLAVGALTLGWTLACSGLTDQIKGAVADQMEIVIAENMGIDPADVEIKALDSGRWSMDTPDWDANCGFGPTARPVKPFVFEIRKKELMGDCRINAANCKDVLGVPCGKDGADIGLVVEIYPNNTKPGKSLLKERKAELEALGLNVRQTKDEKNPDAYMLTASKGKKVRAVALVSSEDGNAVEILVAPMK